MLFEIVSLAFFSFLVSIDEIFALKETSGSMQLLQIHGQFWRFQS